jgi:hypothetical protein
MAAPAFKVCPFAGAKKITNNRISSSLMIKKLIIGKCGNVEIEICEYETMFQ